MLNPAPVGTGSSPRRLPGVKGANVPKSATWDAQGPNGAEPGVTLWGCPTWGGQRCCSPHQDPVLGTGPQGTASAGWGGGRRMGGGARGARCQPQPNCPLLFSPLAEKTGKVLGEFARCYKEQYGVALFNSVRYEIEGNGGPQAQLLHRKVRARPHRPGRDEGTASSSSPCFGQPRRNWERNPQDKEMDGVSSPRGSPGRFSSQIPAASTPRDRARLALGCSPAWTCLRQAGWLEVLLAAEELLGTACAQ